LQIDGSEQSNNTLQVELASRVLALAREPKPRLVWCGLLTSVKRKLLMSLIGVSASLWLNLHSIEKMLDERSKKCLDCDYPLETIPFDRGKYQGDNEPNESVCFGLDKNRPYGWE